MVNEAGGVKIGDTHLRHQDRHLRRSEGPQARHRRHGEDGPGRHPLCGGPNVDDGAAAVRPVAEAKGIIYFPYAFPKALYTKPASNAVLGMVANYQSGPAIYKYLQDNKGVKTIAFVAANESDPLSQRDGGVAAAKALGLKVRGRQGHLPERHPRLHAGADADRQAEARSLVLSGVAPANAPLLIRAARELGYRGPDLDRNRAGRQGA